MRRPIRRRKRTRRRQSRAMRQRNANSSAINKLVRDLYVPRQFSIANAQVISTKTFLFPLMQPDNWDHVFQNYGQQGVSAGVGTSYNMSGIRSKWLIQPESTLEGTVDAHVQIFIVSLMKFQKRKFLNDNATLTEGLHYVEVPLDTGNGLIDGFGNFMINRQIFKVHYNSGSRRLANATLTGTDVTNIRDTMVTGGTYTRFPRKIKSESGGQQFAELQNEEIRDSAQLYMLVMSNADKGSLFLSHNHVIYGTSTRGL